ncbi:hypothetical protein ACJJTC_002248 [Scirpophaga incertulas]
MCEACSYASALLPTGTSEIAYTRTVRARIVSDPFVLSTDDGQATGRHIRDFSTHTAVQRFLPAAAQPAPRAPNTPQRRSIAFDRLKYLILRRAQNIVSRAINGTRAIGSPTLY